MIYPIARSDHHHMFFFFNDTSTTEIYTLSLHDALPIFKDPTYDDTMYVTELVAPDTVNTMPEATLNAVADHGVIRDRKSTRLNSSHAQYLVCRLLLEKKNGSSIADLFSGTDDDPPPC